MTLKGHQGAVRSVKFSADTSHLITGSDDKTAKIWSLPSRKFVCSLVGHTNWVRSAGFSPDTSKAITCSDDKLVKLWDVATHRELHTFYDHIDVVNQCLYFPDGNCIASASSDNTIKVWDSRSHQLLHHYPAHASAVTSLSVHSSGNYLLSTSKDSTIKVWDIREGHLMYTLQGMCFVILSRPTYSTNALTFHLTHFLQAMWGRSMRQLFLQTAIFSPPVGRINLSWSGSPTFQPEALLQSLSGASRQLLLPQELHRSACQYRHRLDRNRSIGKVPAD